MIALGVVLFTLTARSETGKADAGSRPALRTAVRGLRTEAAARGAPLRARSRATPRFAPRSRRATGGRRAAARASSLRGRRSSRSSSGRARRAPSRARARRGGRGRQGRAASRRAARRRARSVVGRRRRARATTRASQSSPGSMRSSSRERRPLATHRCRLASASGRTPGESRRRRDRGRGLPRPVHRIASPAGRRCELAIFRATARSLSDAIANNRLLIGGVLLVVRAASRSPPRASSCRALHRPDATLPGRRPAARRAATSASRSGRGRRRVRRARPRVQQHVASSSRRRSRRSSASASELEETIRRVGDALATGLDRNGVVELAVRQAVDACEAEAGRALPLAHGAFHEPQVRRRSRSWSARSRRPSARPSRARGGGRSCSSASRATRRADAHAAATSAPGRRPRAVPIGLRSLVAGPRVPRRDLDRPPAARPSRARRRSCSSTWPARRWSRSRTRPARDGRAPGGHRRADRASPTSRAFHVDARPRDRAQPPLRHAARRS